MPTGASSTSAGAGPARCGPGDVPGRATRRTGRGHAVEQDGRRHPGLRSVIMSYRPVSDDPEPERVRRITLLLLLADGTCLRPVDGGPALATGDIAAGEHWLLDGVLRIPMQTHGFRAQGVHTVAVADLADEPGALHL